MACEVLALNLNDVSDRVLICAACGADGYGAGPCACCDSITCYDCARAEHREGYRGEFWFCPTCSAFSSEPLASIARYGDRNVRTWDAW